jgi:hypothetical protein
MKLHMSHYCMESEMSANPITTKSVGNSGGRILARLPPIHATSLPVRLGATILARMREAVTIQTLQPPRAQPMLC